MMLMKVLIKTMMLMMVLKIMMMVMMVPMTMMMMMMILVKTMMTMMKALMASSPLICEPNYWLSLFPRGGAITENRGGNKFPAT